MHVSSPAPAESIAGYVERILVIENAVVTNQFALPLFANGTPTLLFLTAKASIGGKPTNYLTLFGQTVFPETLTIKEDFTLIAYFFKPFTLFSLFGVSAGELTNYPIDLNLLSYAQANELKEELLNAVSTTEMMTLLDTYILQLITKTRTESEVLRFATSVISANPSKEQLSAIQKELSITERTFERMFEKNIGIPPNLFRRICQFNAAFQQLNSRRFDKLSDIAFGNGYADQSHFIRVFKEFTHSTPKKYLKPGNAPEE